MKIQSSDVQMQAHTTNELEVNVQSSFEFKQTLLGLIRKESEEPIAMQEAKDVDNIEKTHEEMQNEYKTIHDELSRLILELILIHFLGVNPKEAKIQALEEYPEEKPKLQDTKMVVQTDFKFERTIEYTKKDTVDFSTKAVIETEDKNIELDLNVAYTQEFYEKHEERLSFSEVSFIDPLVIQYGTSSTALDFLDKEMNFTFDIDADGKEDELASLKEGNGFLALDKNSNGKIDDGMELFGPATNNGFEELRAYDSDANGWIDESDPIFSDLRIWSKNSEGEEELFALGDSNIGAIYLSDISTSMDINKNVVDPIAHLKSTSFFVREDGSAGLLSSLDFVS